jgi:hypothetical protein
MPMTATCRTTLALALAILSVSCADALVTADEAAALGTNLTPLGAEKAGNKDGTIPSWDGGETSPAPGYVAGGARPDMFAEERRLFSITARNVDEYASRLTEGTKALLHKYPESYRVDVYPTHRTAAAPQRVYDATRRNAVIARLIDGPTGLVPDGAFGGIPFPLPKNGAEAIWNYLLYWRGESIQNQTANYMGTADGSRILVDGGTFDTQIPYYFADGTADRFNGEYSMVRIDSEAPPHRKGTLFVGRDHLNADRSDAWAYQPGQRRVRKLPNGCCDLPLPSAAGVITSDEPGVFDGRIDRFEWTLVGKAEKYIPYNNNRSLEASVDELLLPHHLNPDHVRWELHRVWIVEAKLVPGQRHAMIRSRYYLDEDTWIAVLGDRWDMSGTLARTLWSLPLVLPDLPAVAVATSGGHDLVKGTWIAMDVLNGKPAPYKLMPRFPDAHFTADAMAGEGVR